MLVTVSNFGVEEQNDIVAAHSLEVLPNPSVGFITVDTEKIFKIVDVSGRVVASGSGGSYILAPGIYFIVVEESDTTHSEKIVVVR